MKAVKTALQEAGKPEDEVKAFEKGAQTYVKEKLLPNFKGSCAIGMNSAT